MKTVAERLMAAFVLCAITIPSLMGQGNLEPSTNESARRVKKDRGQVRPVTIPITPHVRGLRQSQDEELITLGDISIKEDGEEQKVLSIRTIGNAPLALAVLIQDDVVSSIANEIKGIGEFIKTLPKGSRVMVGYIRSGSLQVRQKFTTDLEKAVRSLRIPISSANAAPYNPYVEIIEGLRRFEALPSGRRAMLVITDGLDTSEGVSGSSAGQSLDLQRAIREAQRRSVAVYSIYAPTVTATSTRNPILVNNAQGSLERMSEESGGRAFFQGTGAPVSFDPFLRELGESLFMQLAVTFLSTNPNKGFHRIEASFARQGVKVDYPAGYVR
jgi:VWFA-related protein